ncbi:METTL5 family protein [Ferroplasma sp.]|uniref:METTL5 family protein n=1 Tax=Ferroplasma sp. TaxID=2591003 RepID=UPI00307F0E77
MEPYRNKINKKSLEIFLSSLKTPLSYNINLEQYPTDAVTASTILFEAFMDGNISGKTVIDPGTGNGIFAIGSCYLGASHSTGVDIDPNMISIARRNSELTFPCAEFINSNISEISGNFDTVIMNPPFGSITKHDDIPFIEKALEVGKYIYAVHNIKSYEFIKNLYSQRMQIIRKERIFIKVPRIYAHHKDEYHEIESMLVYGTVN